MSLEVGEHIPSAFEHILFDNLHYNNKCGVILSWAVPGQARSRTSAQHTYPAPPALSEASEKGVSPIRPFRPLLTAPPTSVSVAVCHRVTGRSRARE